MKADAFKTLASNRKAYHDYFIEDTFEAGIVLTGTEIKSVRAGQVNLRDSFATIKNGESVANEHAYRHLSGRFVFQPRATPPAQAADAPA